MLIDKSREITFIHGWLFGPYMWQGVKKYFKQVKKHTLISLSGYGDKSKYTFDNSEQINNILKSSKEGDIIFGYSYSATLILKLDNLDRCKGTIILINPFYTFRDNTINNFSINIKNNFDINIKKFIFNCTKGIKNSKTNYTKLCKLFDNHSKPSLNSLYLGLEDLKNINKSDKLITHSKNLHIIQSLSDEVSDIKKFYQLEKDKFNTYRLEGSPHFPFFEFDKIYEIIKKIK